MPPKKKARTSKKQKSESELSEQEVESEGQSKAPKRARKEAKKEGQPLNKTDTEFTKVDFSNSASSSADRPWNFKIASWNVDGLRSWIKKGSMDYLKHETPDILCLQETKCAKSKIPNEANVDGYHAYWCSSETEGYAGVGLYSKIKPISLAYGIGLEDFDKEGRVIVAEYEKFYLINVYVPNAGRKLVTLPKRLEWNKAFDKFVVALESKKPVIICGDMNVAHQEIDIANPKSNQKNAGFTKEEREGFTQLLSTVPLIDAFRYKYPDKKGAYSFWTYMANARKRNIGWRLDYFLLSKKLLDDLCDCVLRDEVFGSDHCPLVLFLTV